MDGSGENFARYIAGSNKRFVIPVYQRNYDWRIEQCKRLYDDLVKTIRDNRESHFFGSIVASYNPKGRHHEEFLIIDGQQRITTVSLLLLAMYNLLDKKIVVSSNDKLKDEIFEEFLVDKWQPEETRIKLKPIKDDQVAYRRLFGDVNDYIIDSNITENYMYFYNRIQKQEITIDQLDDAIYDLEIIDIKLEEGDNPQLIFESLNSTGLDLSEGDKIRNYILMGLPTKEQNEYYEKYWNQIEICTQYGVSAFARDYLSVKQQSTPSQSKIYTTFRDYIELSGIETEPLLEDMLAYARRYQVLLGGKKTPSQELNACIDRLNRLETTVTRPFFLEVLRLYDEGALTIDEVASVFQITESYLFRRNICDLPTNALNKIFLTMHKEIERYDGTDENYVEKYKYALLSRREKSRFPDDEEFSKAFSEKQVYLMNNKNKIYILERLENYGIAEDKDIYRHCDDGIYSIEHIMPQHLTPKWQEELGEDYERIHETWLHRIANLTLTAYNSNYSNNTFTEKKTMQNGFIESGIRMNMYIAQNDKWTEAELEARDAYLTARALMIWPEPKTDYKPAEKQLDSYTLEDEEVLPGRQLAKFSFKGTEFPVKSWVEMYQKVIRMLYDEDQSIITKLAVSDDDNLSIHFSTDPNAFKSHEEIVDGIYVWTNNDTQNKLSVLNRLFALYNESPTDLIFYLRGDSEDEPGSWQELHRRYWTYALPIIKEANQDNGAFSKVNPSKQNWVNGYYGVGGFSISCIANYDSARIDMYFGKPDARENKRVYDYLYNHKNEINDALSDHLIWQRGDDIKSSRISYELLDVSIGNENDWSQMAKFHADWSKRFYDVLVPYVEVICNN